jgi:hypothetical protein
MQQQVFCQARRGEFFCSLSERNRVKVYGSDVLPILQFSTTPTIFHSSQDS